MRRHAKASSAGSTSGTGSSRGLFGRAFATRGGSVDAEGSGAPSGRSSTLVLVVAVCVFAALLAAPFAFAGNKVVTGNIGTGAVGGGKGELNNVKGFAVNQSGVGGVTAGDVYAVDAANNRIEQFSAAGAFVRAWGYDVVSSGQDNTGANEQQKVTVKATAGVFSLSVTTVNGSGKVTNGSNTVTGVTTSLGAFKVGDTITGTGIPANTMITAVGAGTLTLSANGSAGAVGSTPLTATENTGGTGTGNLTAGSKEVTGLVTRTGEFAVGKTVTGTGIPVGTKIEAVGAGTLTLTNAVEAGKSGTAIVLTATNIPFNATAGELQAALEALPGVGASGLGVSRNEVSPSEFEYFVTFSGSALKGDDVAQMTSSAAGLSAGTKTVSVATTVPGGGFEICNEGASPVDVCKAGTVGAAAGSFSEIQGIAVDQANGNVYVVSQGNHRIDIFSATGKFEGAFGWNVNVSTPAEELQLCTTASGCKAGVTGAKAGQFAGLESVSPGISPVNGHIFLPDPGNTRVDEFIPTLNGSKEVTAIAFDHAFGANVTPPINELQTVTLTGATGGSFSITFEGETTGATGTGNVTNGSKEITGVATSTGAFIVGEEVSGTGIPAGTTITAINTGVLTISANATATNAATPISASIPYNASAATIQSALVALPRIGTSPFGGANVTVTGSAGGPWSMEFVAKRFGFLEEASSKFRGVNVPQMSTNASALTGASPSAAVATVRQGANGTYTGLEQCTVATTCGSAGPVTGEEEKLEPGGFGYPVSAAVDSSGAIYVVDQGSSGGTCNKFCRVQKFNAATTEVQEFAPAQLNASQEISGSHSDGSVAVDPASDHVFVTKRESPTTSKLFEFYPTGNLIASSPLGNASSFTGTIGLAVGTGERLYFGGKILGGAPAPKAVTIEPPTGITTTTAIFKGGVSLPEGGLPTFAHFEYSPDGVNWTSIPTEEFELGNGTGAGSAESCPAGNPPKCNVKQTVTGLVPNTTYQVRLIGSAGTPTSSTTLTFKTLAGRPTISGTVAEPVSQNSATLTSYVNPNAQSTTYHFEWGTDTSYGTRIPVDFDAVAGSGGQPVRVTASLSGLEPHTSYHFRLIATNFSGATTGPDQEFVTLNTAGLPDNRGLELVSPADKRPQGTAYQSLFNIQVDFQPAENGDSAVFPVINGLAEPKAGGSLRYIASRGESGWQSTEISPASLITSPQAAPVPGEIMYASPDLSCTVASTFNPLTKDTPPSDVELGVANIYRRDSDGTYTLITNTVPTNPSISGEHASTVWGASSGCNQIFFNSAYKLLGGPPSGLYEWGSGTLRDAGTLPNGAAGSSVKAGGTGTGGTSSGGGGSFNAVAPSGRLFFTAVSNEGGDSGKSVVFVRKGSAVAGGTGDLTAASATVANLVTSSGAFAVGETITGAGIPAGTTISALGSGTITLSNAATATTPAVPLKATQVVDASQKQGGVSDDLGAHYQIASPDGKHVFFTANYGLTALSSSGLASCNFGQGSVNSGDGCDLYDYNVETGTLKDRSVDTNPADTKGAGVVGVAAVSNDGSYVYFSALGQLIPGQGKKYSQNTAGQGSYNVYLAHNGEFSYVATVANSDMGAGNVAADSVRLGGDLVTDAPAWNSDTSADGHRFLFTSLANVTGYNSGNVIEAYLYSAESGKTICVSCRLDGLPSVGKPAGGTEPLASTFSGNQAQYFVPHSMSDDGRRVFFTMPDVLTPNAVSGRDNLYEWEEGQLYLLHVFNYNELGGVVGGFRGSSASGNDVFINTPDQLVPQDFDFNYDFYDLRVNGSFPAPEVSVPCDPAADQCQGAPTSPPASPSPTSSGFSGPGNPPVSPAGPKKHHPKKHHKKKPHQKRAGHNSGGQK